MRDLPLSPHAKSSAAVRGLNSQVGARRGSQNAPAAFATVEVLVPRNPDPLGTFKLDLGERRMGQTATIVATLASALQLVTAVPARADEAAPDLSALSLEQLADLQVTSVSKRAEAVVDAPSSIYVITRGAIARSGRTSLPEILRLAPNLQVSQ